MANTLQLKNDIKKLKTALASKGLSASIKNKLKGKLEKAQTDLKSTAPRKVSGAKSTIASLKELVKKKKYGVYKRSGVDLKKDAEEPALRIGRRVSKGIKGNQYGNKKSSKGNVYYEYRANRLDVKQPSKTAKYPKLEDGGMMAKGGENTTELQKYLEVASERAFAGGGNGVNITDYGLSEAAGTIDMYHDVYTTETKNLFKKMVDSMVKDEIKNNQVGANDYKKGGKVKEPVVVRSYFEEEAYEYAKGGSLKSVKEKYLENEDNNAHSENVVLLAKNFGTKEDLAEAKTILALHEKEGQLTSENGKKRRELHLKLINKARAEMSKEGIEFAKGGMMAEGGVTEKEVVDSNAQMVLSKIKEVHHHADELGNIVNKKSDIEAWVVAKIERASTDLSDITHYLDGQHDKMSMGGGVYNHLHKMDKK